MPTEFSKAPVSNGKTSAVEVLIDYLYQKQVLKTKDFNIDFKRRILE